MGVSSGCWLEIDKRLHAIWKTSQTHDRFIEIASQEFKWTKKQTEKNTVLLVERFKKGLENEHKRNKGRA